MLFDGKGIGVVGGEDKSSDSGPVVVPKDGGGGCGGRGVSGQREPEHHCEQRFRLHLSSLLTLRREGEWLKTAR